MDFLKSAVASAIAKGISSPYLIGDRLDNGDSIFTLHRATKRDDGTECCLFTFDIAPNKSRLPLAKNASRKLRTLRYPGIVKALDVVENDHQICIVTEKITPLSWHVKRKSLSEETIKWGLYTVASTLKFVNSEAASVHGNVRVSSIYTSGSGEWKLGGFEVLSSMNDDNAIIYNYATLVPDASRYAPPEVASNGWSAIKKGPLAAADAYGLGVLIHEAFNGGFMGPDQLARSKNIPSTMVQSYKRLLNNNPKVRLTAANFLEQGQRTGGFFETPLIHITEGANKLGLKNETERDDFLTELDGLSDDFPEDFFKMKILPELLKAVEFGGGGPKVFGAIMKISAKLSDDEFESQIVPVALRLFNSPDRAIRVCLLDNLPLMVDRIPQKEINGKIFPSMVTGFSDTVPVVREQTVKAVLAVISKLSDRTINGELLRHLAKTANDEQPGIRTNTTICLGKIARNLGTGSRSKVLIAAFTRSLRDPFVHARSAALMALSATIDVFSEEDCAGKILPALCMPLIDKEKIVRDQANKTIDAYLQRVRKHASTMSDSVLSPETAAGATGAPTARIGNQSDVSWAGWAISSFTNKLGTARGEMQTATPNGTLTRESASLPPSGRATPSLPDASGKTVPVARNSTTGHTVQSSTPQDEVEQEQEDVMDAWGTMDDEHDSFFDAPSDKKTAAVETRLTVDDASEPDFAGWLASQSKSKRKPLLPKGFSKLAVSDAGTRPSITAISASTGPLETSVGTQRSDTTVRNFKVLSKVLKPELKPKQPDPGEDDWGDAWD